MSSNQSTIETLMNALTINENRELRSIIKIQSWVRMCLSKRKSTIETLMNALTINENRELRSIIKIQSWIRMCLAKHQILIPSAKYQTKTWRKNRSWYSTGKSNECEKYQIRLIEQITSHNLVKTSDRIHIRSLSIVDKKHPMKDVDGFEYTENFDGIYMINDHKVYFNLKFVCDMGGAQMRSLREVYHFICYQLEILQSTNDTYFINILDGDTSYKSMRMFLHLINDPEYSKIKKYIFVGDMSMFQIYWASLSI